MFETFLNVLKGPPSSNQLARIDLVNLVEFEEAKELFEKGSSSRKRFLELIPSRRKLDLAQSNHVVTVVTCFCVGALVTPLIRFGQLCFSQSNLSVFRIPKNVELVRHQNEVLKNLFECEFSTNSMLELFLAKFEISNSEPSKSQQSTLRFYCARQEIKSSVDCLSCNRDLTFLFLFVNRDRDRKWNMKNRVFTVFSTQC